MRVAVFIVVAILLPAHSTADEENWPQFRGPTGDGQSDAVNVPLRWSESENIAWKTPIHGRAWSSPVVWGSRIWMTTATEDGKQLSAICVDRDSGKILHDFVVFEGHEVQITHAFNSHASPTPVVERDRVWLHFGVYGTACLDSTTGRVIWTRRDLYCDHFRGPGSSPMLDGDLLILHFDGIDVQYLVALDKTTGETVWKTPRSTDFGNLDGDLRKAYSTPLIIESGGRRQLISPGAQAAMAYDPATGKELWTVRYRGFSNVSRPLFGHGLVFINTGFAHAQLWAVRPDGNGDVTDTHVAWRLTQSVPAKPTPVLVDGLLFMVDDEGVGSCIEATTGTVVWRERVRGNHSASPVHVAGRLYFFDDTGTTTVLSPTRRYEVLAKNQLDAGCMASPAIIGRAIYLRTKTHLYRIEKAPS